MSPKKGDNYTDIKQEVFPEITLSHAYTYTCMKVGTNEPSESDGVGGLAIFSLVLLVRAEKADTRFFNRCSNSSAASTPILHRYPHFKLVKNRRNKSAA